MKVATIRISENKEIELEAGGMSPAEIVTALDAVINVVCQRATGDPIKGIAMKEHCAKINLMNHQQLILPAKF